MNKTSVRLLMAVGFVLLALLLAGCPTATSSTGYNFSGSFSKIGIADNTYAYAKLVTQGGLGTDAALYWTRSTPFSGGSADFSMGTIPQGTYTLWAFIDVDGNAPNNATALPDTGDWVTHGDETIDSDTYSAYLEGTWTLY